MQILLIKSDKLFKYPFPSENMSTYWIKDYDENGNERELIFMEQKDNSWFCSTCKKHQEAYKKLCGGNWRLVHD